MAKAGNDFQRFSTGRQLVSSQGEIFLFRGDASLPKGLPPYSAALRRLLRTGMDLTNASDLTSRMAWSMMIDEPYDDIFEHSERASSWNVLVSTSRSLKRAIFYATQYGTRPHSGYVSVIKVKPERCVDICAFYTGGLAKTDAEVGIKAYISDFEIFAQIDVAIIEKQLSERDIDKFDSLRQDNELLASLPWSEYPFRPAELCLACPNCGNPLYQHLSEYIGFDSKAIEVLDITPYVRESGPPYFLPSLTPSIMAENGAVVKCFRCDKYILNKKISRRELVGIRVIKKRRRCVLEIENRTGDAIIGICFWLFQEGKRTAMERQLVGVLSRGLGWGLLVGKVLWDKSIGPFARRTIEAPRERFDRIVISRVDFDSGRKWCPFDRYLEDVLTPGDA